MAESRKIVLDTNFLLIPGQFGVDIFTEIQRTCDFPYELHIMETTLKELKDIMEKSAGTAKQAAKLALELVKAKDINIISSDVAYVDKAILDTVDENTIVGFRPVNFKSSNVVLIHKFVKSIGVNSKNTLFIKLSMICQYGARLKE